MANRAKGVRQELGRHSRHTYAVKLHQLRDDLAAAAGVKALPAPVYHRLIAELDRCRDALIMKVDPWMLALTYGPFALRDGDSVDENGNEDGESSIPEPAPSVKRTPIIIG